MTTASSPTLDPVRIGHFSFPANKQRLPDGRWVVTPGEPQMRVRTTDAARITGIPSKTLHRLADAGVIHRAMVTPNIVFRWPAEIEAMTERVACDEAFARVIRAPPAAPRRTSPRHHAKVSL